MPLKLRKSGGSITGANVDYNVSSVLTLYAIDNPVLGDIAEYGSDSYAVWQGDAWYSIDVTKLIVVAFDIGDLISSVPLGVLVSFKVPTEYVVHRVVRASTTVLYALGSSGDKRYVYKSSDNGATWTYKGTLGYSKHQDGAFFAVSETTLVWACFTYVSSTTMSIFRSTDSGVTWTEITNLGSNSRCQDGFKAADGSLYITVWWAGGATSSVYKSSDTGLTWSVVKAISTMAVMSLESNSSSLCVLSGYGGGRIANSIDMCVNVSAFTTLDSSTNDYDDILSMSRIAIDGSVVYAVTALGNLFVSTDSGASYSQRTMSIVPKAVATLIEGVVIVIGSTGLYYTQDNGISWTSLDVFSSVSFVALQRMGTGEVSAMSYDSTVYIINAL